MLPVFFILVSCLSTQPSLQKKKKFSANFGSKELNYTYKKFRDQIKFFLKNQRSKPQRFVSDFTHNKNTILL
jgi:hypothetical protein